MPAPVHETPACGPPPSADAIRICLGRLFRGNVRAYRRELARCRSRLGRGPVHDLRIAIRRLLVCLELLGAAGGGPSGAEVQLRRQLRALGRVRNAQIQLKLLGKGPPRCAEDLGILREHLRRRKRRRTKEAARILESDKAARRLQDWRPRLGIAGPRIVPRLRRLVDGKIRAAMGSLARAPGPGPADSDAWHRTRVLSRECCHTVEALRPCWRGERTDELLASLRALHRVTGRIHDRELLLRRMGRLVAEGRLGGAPSRLLASALRSGGAGRMAPPSPQDWRAVLETLLSRRGDFHRWPGR
jgi:CHAD domain-containing protein